MVDKVKTMRRTGTWCIVMGIASAAIGAGIGAGCIVAGATLKLRSKQA